MKKDDYYTLRHRTSGKLVRFDTSPNEEAMCVPEQHRLHLTGANLWKVDTPEEVLWVLRNPTPYYNASHNTPTHAFIESEWEVVRVQKKVVANEKWTQTPVSVVLPDPVPFCEFRMKSDAGYERIRDGYRNGTIKMDYYRMLEIMAWKQTFAYKLMVLNDVLTAADPSE